MKRSIDKRYLALGIILGALLLVITITSIFAMNNNTKNQDDWVLRSYENTVVLMNNGKVIEVFGDILVEELPAEDIKHLENGIPFLSKDEALMAIEDYDG